MPEGIDDILKEGGYLKQEEAPEQTLEPEVEETPEAPVKTAASEQPETPEQENTQEAAETGPIVINLGDPVEEEPETEEPNQGVTQIGDFDSPEDLLSAYETLRDAPKPQVEFANETVKALNDYLKMGGTVETFMSTQAVDIETMSPLDKIILAETWANPHTDKDTIRDVVMARYNPKVDDISGEVDQADKKVKEGLLKYDAGLAHQKILERKVKNTVPDQELQRQAAEQAETQRMEKWGEPVAQTFSSMKELSIKVGEKATVKYPINKSELESVKANVMNMLETSPGFEPSRESIAQVREIAMDIYKAQNFDKIFSSLYDRLSTQVKIESFNEKHNASGTPGVQSAPNAEVEMSVDEQVDQLLGL